MIRDYVKTIELIEGHIEKGDSGSLRSFLQQVFPTDIAYIASHIDEDYSVGGLSKAI